MVFLLTNALIGIGQSYPLGINPPTLEWRTINTDKVNVVYPEVLEQKAQYVANLVHLLWDSSYYALGTRHEKVSIILQNQNTTSNGFVTVSPFRSEFYLTPPQYSFLGNVDWLTGLTIHEYRHIEQFVNAKKSITKLGSILFGQNGWGLTAGLALPRWFFEGDAVFYETVLSHGGRGRMPDFENEYKALLLQRKNTPGYEKASATSLKEFIPNHYTLGYFMTTGMRRDFGNDTLEQIVDRAVSYQSILFPFSLGMKKLTDYRTPQYFRKLMLDLKAEWMVEDSLSNHQSGLKINAKKKKTFTSYSNPVQINDSLIAAYKSGYRDIFKIVSIDIESGEESKIVEPGFIGSSNTSLSTNGRYLVWAQTGFHPRWELVDYSEIWAYDLLNRETFPITRKSRFFTPAIDPTGSDIAAIEISKDQSEKLVILNSGTGKVKSSYKFNEGERGAFPAWSQAKEIYFVLQKPSTNALAVFDPKTESIQMLTPEWEAIIGYPIIKDKYIYFNATFSGTDNIYRWDLESKQLQQITESRFGAIQPLLLKNRSTLVASDYSNEGYDLKLFEIENPQPVIANQINNKADFYKPLLSPKPVSLTVTQDTFPSQPLKSSKGLFNVHSWTPWFFPPNFGLTIEADNIMTTFSTEASFTYNTNEMASTFGLSSKYGAHFPVFELDLSRGNRNRYLPVITQVEENLSLNIQNQQWIEDDISFGVTLPLNTTWKNYFSNITVTQLFHKKWIRYENTSESSSIGSNESFESYSLDFSAYFLRRKARQHLQPRFGISTDLKYRSTLGTTQNKSDYFQTNTRFYLPGISRNHSFNISISHQQESYLSNYKFRDDFFYTRGYGAIPHDRITNTGFNYSLPLLYPDLPLGPFAFIKRIKVNMFYDIARLVIDRHALMEYTQANEISLSLANGFTPRSENMISSIGTEFTFDLRLFRSLDIDTGLRVTHPLNEDYSSNDLRFEFLLFSLDI